MGNKNYFYTPAVLVAGHGPFIWGEDPAEAVHNSVGLEEVAEMALNTVMLNPSNDGLAKLLMDKHFFRKHGKDAPTMDRVR
ncbi:MAG: hypothetical protein FH762_00190 [Firmicutes bacterium]|nr:hypothetical protein [Bacillota bacterium]